MGQITFSADSLEEQGLARQDLPNGLKEIVDRVLAMDRERSASSHPRRQRRVSAGMAVEELEAELPRLIEEQVALRIQQMTATLQQELETAHVRALEAFVQDVNVKLVKRISALETNITSQGEAMSELRGHLRRTEDNLVRLITGVERLTRDLPAGKL